jgi:nitroreductase
MTSIATARLDPALLAALEAARHGPSAHNSQPWSLRVTAAGVEVRADPARALPAGDPDGDYLLTGLGAAAEALAVGGRAAGLHAEVEVAGDPRRGASVAVALEPATPRGAGSARALRSRRTSRLPLSSAAPPPRVVSALVRAAAPAHLFVREDLPGRRRFAELVGDATARNLGDPQIFEEFSHWLRLGVDRTSADGLTAEALGFGPAARAVAPVVMRPATMRVLAATGAHRALAATQRRLAGAAGAVLLLVAPSGDPAGRVEGGSALMRTWLAAELAGLRVHPMTAPMDHPSTREALAELFGVPPDCVFVACARLGAGPRGAASPRRPLTEIVDEGSFDVHA